MSNYTDKIYFSAKGTVQMIGDLVEIKREGIPDMRKKVLTLETPDGQILFPELRNARLGMLDSENIEIGSAVEIHFLFQGSEKNGKRYNNIYIHSIKSI